MIVARVQIPFAKSLSKNAMWKAHGSRMRSNRSTAIAKNAVALLVKAAMTRELREAKAHLAIHVAKPNHRFDAANFVDVILDAVQDATGLNDRWFSGSWDWSIDRENPTVTITISQEIG